MKPTFSLDDKIATVDILIEDFRWARNDPMLPENRTYAVLKALAKDLRVRKSDGPVAAVDSLARRVAAVRASATALGHSTGSMVGLAQETLRFWPAIEQALRRFAALEQEQR